MLLWISSIITSNYLGVRALYQAESMNSDQRGGSTPSGGPSSDRNPQGRPIEDALPNYLSSKGKGRQRETGNYRRNLKRVVGEFIDFLEDRHVTTFDDLQARSVRQYVKDLNRRDLSNATVQTYYNYVSSFLGWCSREGYIPENYAQRYDATEELPDDDRRPGDQQQWTPEQRDTIARYVNDRAHRAVDERGSDAITELRDRAFVHLLCYSGVRGGEVLANEHDTRRAGLEWRDVDLQEGSMTILSKKQEIDDRALPPQVRPAFERLRDAVSPPDDRWPVFPTFHRPTLADNARATLSERGLAEDEIAAALDEHGSWGVHDAFEIRPPSLQTGGGRDLMQRLCDDLGIELEDGEDYLQPHGGRRGVGETLVRTRGVTQAARVLDSSEKVVRDHYSYIEAGELAEDLGQAFEDEQNQR